MCCISGAATRTDRRIVSSRSDDAQKSTEDPRLPMEVVARDSEHLSLPDDVRCFNPLNHCRRGFRSSRPLHHSQTPFHMSVIGFHRVVCVPASSLAAR